MKNPYKELDVPKDATDKEIKGSYKDLAKEHHPDMGGDESKFKDINNAYMVLKDPEKRRYYDEHGSEKKNEGDTVSSDAIKIILDAVNHIMSDYGDDIIYVDIIKKIKSHIDANLKKLDSARNDFIEENEEHNKTLKMFKERLKYEKKKSHINFFEYSVSQKIEGNNATIENLNHQEKTLELAREWMGDFSFNNDEEEKDDWEPQLTSMRNTFNPRDNSFWNSSSTSF